MARILGQGVRKLVGGGKYFDAMHVRIWLFLWNHPIFERTTFDLVWGTKEYIIYTNHPAGSYTKSKYSTSPSRFWV